MRLTILIQTKNTFISAQIRSQRRVLRENYQGQEVDGCVCQYGFRPKTPSFLLKLDLNAEFCTKTTRAEGWMDASDNTDPG